MDPTEPIDQAPTNPLAELEAVADRLFDAEAAALAESPLRRPASTYRLQVHENFDFSAVAAIVPYLADLGITDLYLSPHLKAHPGSTHGYDVYDHGKLNPEIGTPEQYRALVADLDAQGMGRVLDIVPNHVGVGGPNPRWTEVLETGPQAPSARFFDIDWHPEKEELEGQLLLPILEDQYGVVLEKGLLKLEREGGAFVLRYHDRTLPIAPRSYALILGQRPEVLDDSFDRDDPRVMEYRSIRDAARNLPPRTERDERLVEPKIREKEVIKRRLDRLCEERPDLAGFVDGNLARFRGREGDRSSFDLLHQLLEDQVYRLAYWRVAAEEINYRRFFDINDLAGLRTEDPVVFEAIHRLIFEWVEAGGVTGLRIDHPDGLADPLGYYRDLQAALLKLELHGRFEAEGGDPTDWPAVARHLDARYRAAAEADPRSAISRRFPVVAEKILSRGESLPEDWPIDGTVGYEYLNALNGVFVDPAGLREIEAAYADFTGDREPFAEVLYRSKNLITRISMASEINVLARRLDRISERDRRNRDFTFNDHRLVLREVISLFPVYRTYVRPDLPVADRDRGYIDQAVHRARRRNPALDASIFDFLRAVLMLEHPEGTTPEGLRLREEFVQKFQQTTGPVQAKGLEDTAFYRQYKLTSLNEVGGDPFRFAVSPSSFHAENADRLARWPGTLGTTATHDTKRGEDTRIRIDVLSELSGEFRTRLDRWSRCNNRRKTEFDEKPAPDAREEYLLYQTLIGAWPFSDDGDESIPEGFVARIQQYLLKAAREAKINTSWTDPDPTYAAILEKFVAEVLESPDAGPFLHDFLPFQRRIARVGAVYSLAQVLLKIVSPGIPDIYQGCELWDLSLVDPDNRRPVDYQLRRQLVADFERRLGSGESRRNLAAALYNAPSQDGAIKLYLTRTLLRHRREHLTLYESGHYRPLDADGEHKGSIVAIGRYRDRTTTLAVAPRLLADLMGEDGKLAPIGRDFWGDTRLVLPEGDSIPRNWRDLLTDTPIEADQIDGSNCLYIGKLFSTLPIALLIAEPG